MVGVTDWNLVWTENWDNGRVPGWILHSGQWELILTIVQPLESLNLERKLLRLQSDTWDDGVQGIKAIHTWNLKIESRFQIVFQMGSRWLFGWQYILEKKNAAPVAPPASVGSSKATGRQQLEIFITC